MGCDNELNLSVNSEFHALDVSTETPLLWVLRDILGLTGPEY